MSGRVTPDEHLFRHEWGRLIAALTRIFGPHQLALAEDVVQDVLLRAFEVWKQRGIPENPAAWLHTAARNRALDILRRQRTGTAVAAELQLQLESEWTLVPTLDELLDRGSDDVHQLSLMFSCCHPRLTDDVRVALVLHLLGGFGAEEVAHAFLLTPAAAEKRLTRAKKVLSESTRLFDLADRHGFEERLPAVQHALYLLFNEGYHGVGDESAVRLTLCDEAMRFVALLLRHPWGAVPTTHALAALMHLHRARTSGRLDPDGHFLAFSEQDRSLWDQALIAEGIRLLEKAATGSEMTALHVEAALAATHATAKSAAATDWKLIVFLYDQLLALRPSPVVAMHRALALAQREGPKQGLDALRTLDGRERLAAYPFYAAALGELELASGEVDAAREHFRAALSLARNATERDHFSRRVEASDRSANPSRQPPRPR